MTTAKMLNVVALALYVVAALLAGVGPSENYNYYLVPAVALVLLATPAVWLANRFDRSRASR